MLCSAPAVSLCRRKQQFIEQFSLKHSSQNTQPHVLASKPTQCSPGGVESTVDYRASDRATSMNQQLGGALQVDPRPRLVLLGAKQRLGAGRKLLVGEASHRGHCPVHPAFGEHHGQRPLGKSVCHHCIAHRGASHRQRLLDAPAHKTSKGEKGLTSQTCKSQQSRPTASLKIGVDLAIGTISHIVQVTFCTVC